MAQNNLAPTHPSEFQQTVDANLSFHERSWLRAAEQMDQEPSFIENLMSRASELLQPKPEPDSFRIALSGFPDVNTYRAHYACKE